MGTINVDTGKLKSGKAKLEEFRVYFTGKAGTFSSGSFGSGGNLDNYLSKVQENYRQIANNIEKVKEYISEYAEDVENLENEMCGEAGSIHDATVSGSISRGKVDIKESKIKKDKLFSGFALGDLGETTQIADEKYDYRKIYNSLIDKRDYKESGSFLANTAVCGLSFLEGFTNVGESIMDGGAWLISVGLSALGADEAAEAVGGFIKKDWTKELYYQAIEKSGLDRYADPNSTGANLFSMAGNIAGNVALSVFTGGAVASVFGVGSKAALAANSIISAGRQALMDAGIGTEMALQRGASLKQAQLAGGMDAAVGVVTGAISGRLDQAARGAGATGDKGKILNYALTSFGVGSSEPLINEATHTAIYYHNDNMSYLENLKYNAQNDGLLMQMLLAGGINALGTLGNGVSTIKRSNKYNLNDENQVLLNSSNGSNSNGMSKLSLDREKYLKLTRFKELEDLGTPRVYSGDIEQIKLRLIKMLNFDYGNDLDNTKAINTIMNLIEKDKFVDDSVRYIFRHIEDLNDGMLKKNQLSFRIGTTNDGAYFNPFFGGIFMSQKIWDVSSSESFSHELGHAFFHVFTSYTDSEIPTRSLSALDTARKNIEMNQSEVKALESFWNETYSGQIKKASDWYIPFKESEMQRVSKIVDEMYETNSSSELKDLVSLSKKLKQAKKYLQTMGMEEKSISEILENKDVTKRIIAGQNNIANISKYVDLLSSNDKTDSEARFCSGIVNSITKSDEKYKFTYGHSNEYWQGKVIKRTKLESDTLSYNEVLADYVSMSANGREDAIKRLESVIGPELFDDIRLTLQEIVKNMGG